jgi:MraZ protein
MQRLVLVGEYDFTLDAKNRVAVPARLRSAFADGIYVTRGLEPCLEGYSPEEFQAHLDRQIGTGSPRTSKGRDVQRFIAAGAVFQELDGQGRVTVPARQLNYAGIGREVTIIGVRDHIEIWDRAAWADYLARLEEEADATADELATS